MLTPVNIRRIVVSALGYHGIQMHERLLGFSAIAFVVAGIEGDHEQTPTAIRPDTDGYGWTSMFHSPNWTMLGSPLSLISREGAIQELSALPISALKASDRIYVAPLATGIGER